MLRTYKVVLRNAGLQTLTVTYQYKDGEEQTLTLGRGEVHIFPDEIEENKRVSSVFKKIVGKYPDTEDIPMPLNKKPGPTFVNLFDYDFTDVPEQDGYAVIRVTNPDLDEGITVKWYSDSQAVEPHGTIDLPVAVRWGEAINTIYTDITAERNERQIWAANTDIIAPTDQYSYVYVVDDETTYHYVTLDLNGATLTKDGATITPPYPKWVINNTWLTEDVGYYVYQQGYTYNAPAPAHAEQGQYGYFNGYTYNGGERYTAGPVTEDLDLVAHTTYGYWTGFIPDFDTQGENIGCGCVCDQAGATGQYLWSEIENALKAKFPNRRLVAVYEDNTFTTQVQFSTQTVDFVEGNWSEPVVPQPLSGTYLAITTELIV